MRHAHAVDVDLDSRFGRTEPTTYRHSLKSTLAALEPYTTIVDVYRRDGGQERLYIHWVEPVDILLGEELPEPECCALIDLGEACGHLHLPALDQHLGQDVGKALQLDVGIVEASVQQAHGSDPRLVDDRAH